MDSTEKSERARKAGLARAAALTPEERSEIARKAVAERWRLARLRGEIPKPKKPPRPKNPHAIALKRSGGSKGGRIAAENMTAEERKERARKAALARWSRENG